MADDRSMKDVNVFIRTVGCDQVTSQSVCVSLQSRLLWLIDHINLSALDGITVASTCDQAVQDVAKRNKDCPPYTAVHPATIGTAFVVGRGGETKVHIALSLAHLPNLGGPCDANDCIQQILTHECAHVQSMEAWNRCFLDSRRKHTHALMESEPPRIGFRTCWEEYAACRISSELGFDMIGEYETLLLDTLCGFEIATKLLEIEFDGDIERAKSVLLSAYQKLINDAGYLLGAMTGVARRGEFSDRLRVRMCNTGVFPFLLAVDHICFDIFKSYGRWTDMKAFRGLSEIAERAATDALAKIVSSPMRNLDTPGRGGRSSLGPFEEISVF